MNAVFLLYVPALAGLAVALNQTLSTQPQPVVLLAACVAMGAPSIVRATKPERRLPDDLREADLEGWHGD